MFYFDFNSYERDNTLITFTCSKSTIKIPEKVVKDVKNKNTRTKSMAS